LIITEKSLKDLGLINPKFQLIKERKDSYNEDNKIKLKTQPRLKMKEKKGI